MLDLFFYKDYNSKHDKAMISVPSNYIKWLY